MDRADDAAAAVDSFLSTQTVDDMSTANHFALFMLLVCHCMTLKYCCLVLCVLIAGQIKLLYLCGRKEEASDLIQRTRRFPPAAHQVMRAQPNHYAYVEFIAHLTAVAAVRPMVSFYLVALPLGSRLSHNLMKLRSRRIFRRCISWETHTCCPRASKHSVLLTTYTCALYRFLLAGCEHGICD